jgi:hypothetical protein
MFLGLDTDNKQNRTDLEQAARFQVIAATYYRAAQTYAVDRDWLLDIASSYYRSARRLMGIEEYEIIKICNSC